MRPDRLARLHAAVDRQAAERIQVVPYLRGGYVVGVPDPDRAASEIDAIVVEIPSETRTAGNATNSGHNAELRTGSHTAKFTTSALPFAVWGSDRVILLDQGDVAMKVNHADPFGTDRTILYLEKLPPS